VGFQIAVIARRLHSPQRGQYPVPHVEMLTDDLDAPKDSGHDAQRIFKRPRPPCGKKADFWQQVPVPSFRRARRRFSCLDGPARSVAMWNVRTPSISEGAVSHVGICFKTEIMWLAMGSCTSLCWSAIKSVPEIRGSKLVFVSRKKKKIEVAPLCLFERSYPGVTHQNQCCHP